MESGELVLYKNCEPQVRIQSDAEITPEDEAVGDSCQEWAAKVKEDDRERNRLQSRLRRWLRKARGLYIDRSGCQHRNDWGCKFRPSG